MTDGRGHPKKRDPESEIRLTVSTHALVRVRASSLPLSFFSNAVRHGAHAGEGRAPPAVRRPEG